MEQQAFGPRRKHRLALAVAPHLLADALASVLADDDVDDVIDLIAAEETDGARILAAEGRFDIAVVSPGTDMPDADVVIVLPPTGTGEVVIPREGRTERVEVGSVAALLDVLDFYDPASRPRRSPAN